MTEKDRLTILKGIQKIYKIPMNLLIGGGNWGTKSKNKVVIEEKVVSMDNDVIMMGKLKKFMEDVLKYNKSTFDSCQELVSIINSHETSELAEIKQWISDMKNPELIKEYCDEYIVYFRRSLANYLCILYEDLCDLMDYKLIDKDYEVIIDSESITFNNCIGCRRTILISCDLDEVMSKVKNLSVELIKEWRQLFNINKITEEKELAKKQMDEDMAEYKRIKTKYNLK